MRGLPDTEASPSRRIHRGAEFGDIDPTVNDDGEHDHRLPFRERDAHVAHPTEFVVTLGGATSTGALITVDVDVAVVVTVVGAVLVVGVGMAPVVGVGIGVAFALVVGVEDAEVEEATGDEIGKGTVR